MARTKWTPHENSEPRFKASEVRVLFSVIAEHSHSITYSGSALKDLATKGLAVLDALCEANDLVETLRSKIANLGEPMQRDYIKKLRAELGALRIARDELARQLREVSEAKNKELSDVS